MPIDPSSPDERAYAKAEERPVPVTFYVHDSSYGGVPRITFPVGAGHAHPAGGEYSALLAADFDALLARVARLESGRLALQSLAWAADNAVSLMDEQKNPTSAGGEEWDQIIEILRHEIKQARLTLAALDAPHDDTAGHAPA